MSATQTIDWSKYEEKPQIDFSKYESSAPAGTGEQFIQQNKLSPFNRQANEFLLGAASHASGLPETQSPVTDALKGVVTPTPLKDQAASLILGPAGSIGQGLYGIGKEIFSSQKAGESPEDAQARRAHGIGSAAGVVAPVALGEGIEGTGQAIKQAIPSTARAGAALADVKGAVGNVPINMAKPGNTALEIFTQSQRGGSLPKAVRDFVNRATKPDSAPLTYAEAKDFQSNISKLSVDEYNRMNPNTRRLVGQLNADLKDSLTSAADTQGKGAQFQQAMKEYHNAMRLRGMSEDAISAAWKAALTGAGIYGLTKLLGIEAPKI